MPGWSPRAIRLGTEAMLVLGIETSCDETAAAVVEDGRQVRSSIVASQDDLHEEFRGVVPEIASRAHAERLLPVIRRALAEACVSLSEVDAVAVGHRPGLIGPLLVGVASAKALAWSLGKPLVGVDHVHAHLYAGLLAEEPRQAEDMPDFPALGLVVSGGHTSMFAMHSLTEITRLGGTIDDAMGEAFDKAATILGLPYPGGPAIDRLARQPEANDRAHAFPISRLAPESLDFSFSGLKTALLYAVRGRPGVGGDFERDHTSLSDRERADLSASFERAAVGAVMLKLERALGRCDRPPRSLLAGGGVTANTRLRRELVALADRTGLDLRLPPLRYCVDNAAMIAGLGSELLKVGRVSDLSLRAVPTTSV